MRMLTDCQMEIRFGVESETDVAWMINVMVRILTLAGRAIFDVSVIFSILSPSAPGIVKKNYYRDKVLFSKFEFIKFRFREDIKYANL